MANYQFTLIIADHRVCSDDMAEAVFNAGGDDATVASSEGTVRVRFSRDAETLDGAIRSAVGTLLNAGYTAAHVEIDDETLTLLTA